LQHFEEFPTGAHDDAVDATALVWHSQTGGSGVWLPCS
jgi:phage terminase large subunit-like protein